MMDGVAYLISRSYRKDALKQLIPDKEEQIEIFVTEKSISRSEFFNAGSNGLRAELVLVTPEVNYSGENEVMYNDVHYAIYRTYRAPESDDVELYLHKKAGVKNG